MANPGKRHWEAVKCILRYLKGTSQAILQYKKNSPTENEIYGFVDSDFAGDLDRRRSLSGYFFLLGQNSLSWKATLQPVVALSTTEAKFIALSKAIKEGIWLKGLLQDYGIKQPTVQIYYDNQSTIHFTKNPQFHNRTKHIDIKFHFVREEIEKGEIEVLKVHTSDNVADILTKPLPHLKFQHYLEMVGFYLLQKG